MPKARREARVVSSVRDAHSPEHLFAASIPAPDVSHLPIIDWEDVASSQRSLADALRDEMHEAPHDPTSVYSMFDQLGDCLYVGITKNAPGRLVNHQASKPWYGDIAQVRMEAYRTRITAMRREAWLVRFARPQHNAQRPYFGDDDLMGFLHSVSSHLVTGETPPWPLIEGFRIPLTREERVGNVAIDNPGPLALDYDREARALMKRDLMEATRDGRLMAACRAVATAVQQAGGVLDFRDAWSAVDDHRHICVSAALKLTEGGVKSPMVRYGPFLMDRPVYERHMIGS